MNGSVTPDSALVAKWRTRAPRYTSYPTAPHFHAIAPAAVDAGLARNTGEFAAYVHLPFCVQRCLYCGCHVEIQGKRAVADPYVDAVVREAGLKAARMQPGRVLSQLSLGGGTPTFLLPEQMRRLVAGLRSVWPFAVDADLAIEIDPRTVDAAYLDDLVDLGFNRFSFGVQDLDPEVLRVVHRDQPVDLTVQALASLRRRGAFDINMDLVYGLPEQTSQGFRNTVAVIAEMRPTRIALFQYAHVPWMKPAQKVLEQYTLPDSDAKADMFTIASEAFGAAGYAPVGMDHFALPGDALLAAQASGTLQRNFEGYTTHGGLDLIGLGVSAIGSFGGAYAQDKKDRAAWTADIAAGQLPTDRGFVLSADDALRRRVIMALFCNLTVTLDEAEYAALHAPIQALAPLAEDGIVHLDVSAGPAPRCVVQITALGRHFIRNVCAAFDAYLESDAGQRRYSVTA